MTSIFIGYCGVSNYGAAAEAVRGALQTAFPDVKINCLPANGKTEKVEVHWMGEAGKKHVWSGNKDEATSKLAEIVEKAKATRP